ncbi:MAG: FlgD immunoglobulin-like domain containing protein [Calditrichia bacterium]
MYQNENFQAIGFDYWNGSSAQVQGFKSATGITYPLAMLAGSMSSLYAITYDRNLIVDQAGLIFYKGTGVASGDINDVFGMVEMLLSPTGIGDDEEVAESYVLRQNYPNPFNPTTQISFTLPAVENVSIRIYDVSGKLVRTLLSGQMNAGTHELYWNGRSDAGEDVSSGVYLYRMDTESFSESRKMILNR